MSLDLKKAVESKFLNAKAIEPNQALVLQINDVDMIDISRDKDGSDMKAGITFVDEGVKPMLLNRTNIQLLELAVGGTSPEDYLGKTIEVWHDPSITNPGGQMVGGIRIRPHMDSSIPS
jgi:hypothetical protein